ncbi:carotenoid 9,10(9',10')-cleavage dioxygenase 1-like [Cynara cardunculus var. scolymus]|uniref:carotenoid 9,10(9',10')-cleavage dioxygenase 1-like n=1 Tax=Cynara cardunculus var. scolymus TaxID=59895 RepID=UPI000D6268F0|nr:carotenoid 9,10(9',10')-cleavage dioxygenase 1-like [Cynara cardunculus var. scolymus]
MVGCSTAIQVNCCTQKPSIITNFDQFKNHLLSSFQPFIGDLQKNPIKIPLPRAIIKKTSMELLDILTNSVFQFIDHPSLSSQSNFAPVEEMGGAVYVDGTIPDGFPEGVYIRNGPNPLFGGFKSTKSIFGRSSHIWVEGEGMLHALYLKKENDGKWSVSYNNKHVETDTFKLEKQRNRPSFLPAIEGDSPAILSAYLLNLMRFGSVNKLLSNTSVFEHSGKFYSAAENHLPQEIDIRTLNTLGNWDVNGSWNRPFTAHPKKAPGSGELVTMGVNAMKPFFEIGIISADGNKLVHKADLKFERCSLCHDIGVTLRYNVILDFPLTIDLKRLANGGPLIKYDGEGYARIGVMPRFGDSDAVRWFDVETCCVFHIINTFEDGDELIMWAFRASDSIIPGPDLGLNKFEWFSSRFKRECNTDFDSDESFFSRAYEWRLNMKTGEVKERYLTGTTHSMDFPMINEHFMGLKNKYGYAQAVDSNASSISGMPKYGGLAKLHLEDTRSKDYVEMEYHKFPENTFCSGAAFVPKPGGLEEDDGWVITFIHNEHLNVSQVLIIDAKKFTSEPVSVITLPSRVPYGFHGAFMPIIL